MTDSMSNPVMIANPMIQAATVTSGILPTNIVCTSTWSGLSVKERVKLLRLQYVMVYCEV
jgi:hypothetical protein